MVANVAPRYHEDHILGDVGGVVAHALEVTRNQDEIQGGFDGGRILQHVIQELAEHHRLQRVQVVVLVQDALCVGTRSPEDVANLVAANR